VRGIFQCIDAIAKMLDYTDKESPLTQKVVLTKIVTSGLFDAPHLVNNAYAKGRIYTKIINGACVSFDPLRDRVIPEEERINSILNEISAVAPHHPTSELIQNPGGGTRR
jgi:hypothetical protein